MIRISKIILFVYGFVFFTQPLVADGFVAGTLVQTTQGFIPIEQLQVGDEIICFDQVDSYIACPITNIATKEATHYIKVCTEDKVCINAAPDQQFYLSPKNQWVEAQHLTTNHVLYAFSTEQVHIRSTEKIKKKTNVYQITLANYHTLCVSTLGIVAHNSCLVTSSDE